jgi:ubiquinone/menaquinone biosynthesis C-methylase UbiE
MRRLRWLAVLLGCVLAVGAGGIAAEQETKTAVKPAPLYETRKEHDPNGIGKFYMGREIAQVMGHEAAGWLERPEREKEEQPSKLLGALKLKPGDVVADIGAGSGYFTFRIAERVGPKGKVLAVDIQQEMLTIIRQKMKARKLSNIEPILGTETDPKLPAGTVDLILMVDVYHEFSYPWEMMSAMIRSLKPGGRLVFVEYRLEDPQVWIKLVHKMTEKQVRKEMEPHPVRWVETLDILLSQHVIVFKKMMRNARNQDQSKAPRVSGWEHTKNPKPLSDRNAKLGGRRGMMTLRKFADSPVVPATTSWYLA